MTEEQNSDEISFHLYIDAVKEKKIPWKAFEKLMKDFYYPDLERLEHLNSMVLMELTKSYSHLERSKCLNAILLNKLKNSMEEENFWEIQVSDNTIHKKIQVDKKMTEEQTADEISFRLYIDAVKEKKIPWNTFVKLMEDFYYLDLERLEHLNSMILMELTRSYSYLERSRYLNAILLNELKVSLEEGTVLEITENEPILDFQESAIINHKSNEQDVFPKDRSIADYDTMKNHPACYECDSCGKSFSEKGKLKRHIYTVHEGHRDYKCESCEKSFSTVDNLKRHMHTVHEGHKDYKCESCSKSFSQGHHLRRHIHAVHEGQKDVNLEATL